MANYDFVVIGGGNTGLSAAYRVARAGKKVALVDKGPVGGLCSLAGCNPKKVFVRATEVLDEIRRAGEHGIRTGPVSIDWSRVLERKKSFTDPVPGQTEESLQKRGIDRIRAEARFLGPDALAAGDRVLQAEGFVVATGSHPRRLAFPGANLVKTSDDVLELQEPPKRMVIVGAGVVAFEFGQVFARLGTKVTMLMRHGRALAGFDEDFIENVVKFTEDLGVEFLKETEVHSVVQTESGLRIELSAGGKRRAIEADFVLNSAGRVAAVESLDLLKAGVVASEKGVVVDDYLRSPGNRRIFAGGDAHGTRQLSPVASYEGRVIARNFLEGDVEEVNYSTIPRAVFTVPPLASVGMTEEEARKAGRATEVAVNDMTNWKVYAIAGEAIARAKLVTEKGTGQILGAQLWAAGAAENIHIFALAMHAGITAEHFKRLVFAYPTFASALESTLS
ncbi:MAG: NAD(P)/FAD-dependent oxidoreductase [Thermoanaerobaculia bacterium]